jgi:hypothetical protein
MRRPVLSAIRCLPKGQGLIAAITAVRYATTPLIPHTIYMYSFTSLHVCGTMKSLLPPAAVFQEWPKGYTLQASS